MQVQVVGGGVIGYAVAFELASRGARVRIADMRGVGLGATRASAGMLAPFIEGHHGPLLRLGACSLSMYDAFVARVAEASGRSLDYRRNGTLQLAASDSSRSALADAAAGHARGGIVHEWLDHEQLIRSEPALNREVSWSGLLLPEQGYVRVPDLMAALESAASRLGVELATQLIDDLRPSSFAADVVVVAAGSWSGLLSSAPVRPIRGQVVQLRFSTAPLSRVTWGEDCYLVPWTDGSVLVGATSDDVGYDERIEQRATERLVASASRVLPSAARAPIVEARVGLRPATPDELPIIGWSSTMPGVMFATGHYRNGILLAPLTATLVADLLLDSRRGAVLDLVNPARFGL